MLCGRAFLGIRILNYRLLKIVLFVNPMMEPGYVIQLLFFLTLLNEGQECLGILFPQVAGIMWEFEV